MDDETSGEIRAAFEEHSVLVFRDQKLDDAKQIAFSDLTLWKAFKRIAAGAWADEKAAFFNGTAAEVYRL
jgi:alpha-ketoglutarate-dependent taurine dioxygenase